MLYIIFVNQACGAAFGACPAKWQTDETMQACQIEQMEIERYVEGEAAVPGRQRLDEQPTAMCTEGLPP